MGFVLREYNGIIAERGLTELMENMYVVVGRKGG